MSNSPDFFSNGVTRPCLNDDGNTPELKDTLASMVISGAMTMGGATVLKVGGGQFCERNEEKFFLSPTFWPVGGQNIA